MEELAYMEGKIESIPVFIPCIKILIVDDREDNLFSMETILENNDYVIRKANSGRAALRILLNESDFTLILMDVQMPDINGFETAAMIFEREKLRHIPIIFITAENHGDENAFRGYKTGGVDYIYKPINPDLLRAKVSVFIELCKKNIELHAQEQKMAAANKLLEKEIHERIRSEEKVTQLNRQLLENVDRLKASNEELERFAYIASHDLQEPLRKINLFSDQLEGRYKEVLNEDGRELISKIVKASDRMRMLIKNVLIYSKSSTNVGAFEETDMFKLVESVLSDLEIYTKEKKAIIEVSPLPVVKVIPSQMRQVFQNLIINAVKFSKENTQPEIHIYSDKSRTMRSANGESQNKFHNIYIRDNGIGFEQKYANEIFTLFKRLNSSERFEGAGIGLSICKKIMEQHNGRINVISSPEQGTTFILSLPII